MTSSIMVSKRRRLSKDADAGLDRLSDLSDDLLISILCFLSTQEAARTSILSRRFQKLWMKCPDVSFISKDIRYIIQPANIISAGVIPMLSSVISNRDPAFPLQRLHLECATHYSEDEVILSLIVKAHSLGLRHLTLNLGHSFIRHMLPTILTLSSLESLSISFPGELAYTWPYIKHILPSTVAMPCLKSLSLCPLYIDLSQLNQLISRLNCLEHLHLQSHTQEHLRLQGHTHSTELLSLSSQTIRHLSLGPCHQICFKLNLPALEFLQIQGCSLCFARPLFEARVPLLKKCIISLDCLYGRDDNYVLALLSCLSHVEELKLVLTQHLIRRMQYRVWIDSGKEFPMFVNLKHLDVTMFFHELNCKDIVKMVCNAPALRSLKLTHMAVGFTTENKKVRNSWRSKLPRNSEGNCHNAYFTNLHLEDNREKVVRLLNKKLRK